MNRIGLEILKETMILLIIVLVLVITVRPFYDFITIQYQLFYLISIFLSVQYFRVVINDRNIFWIKPFVIRLALGILNIGLFFFMVNWTMHFIKQFEDYNYSGIGITLLDIYPGLDAGKYTLLRSTTFFLGSSSLILIVLFQFRMVYSAFKYREMPKWLQNNG